jgi:hypothetical protein
MQHGAKFLDGAPIATWVDPVGEENNTKIKIWIDPQRSPGETQVPNGVVSHQTPGLRTFGGWRIKAERMGGPLDQRFGPEPFHNVL